MKSLLWSVILLFTMNIFASEIDSLKALADYKSSDLQIIFALINDRGFFDEWQKPELPKISTEDTYKRGEEAIPVIIFGTDRKDVDGNANLSYDIKITKPDGSIYGEFKQLEIWNGAPAPMMHLLKQPIIISLEEKDPLGVYTVEAKVYENTKKQTISFKLTFKVVE